jgi:DNA polymerase III epsilon subunit-like protein
MKGASATRDVYFSVDVEASGPVPALYNLVSIGAVPVVFREGAWRPEEDRFYVELRPIAPGFDRGAMKIHGIPREKLEAEGVPADEAMRRLAGFVEGCRSRNGGRAVFVGHNAAFDWSYIAYYFERFGIPNPFGYKALDSKSLAMGRLGIGWFETSKETLGEMLPSVPAPDPGLVHRADYDALFQAYILCALMNHPAARKPGE